MRTDIEFSADGIKLRGWLYLPDAGTAPFPTVVMSNGFALTKEPLTRLAQIFGDAGLACVVYDNRCLGASAGEPRQEVDPWLQIRDYRYAITFAQSISQVDSERIGIWGTSFSGGHVVAVAAIDRRVKCVVAQIPGLSGYRQLQRILPLDALINLQKQLDEEVVKSLNGNPPTVMTMTSVDASIPSAFPESRTYHYYTTIASSEPNWRNEVTLRSIDYLIQYDVTPFISRISPTPLLMIIASTDQITITDVELEVFEMAYEPKKLLMVQGDHYSAYLENFEKTSTAATEWFVEHLTG